MWVDLGASKCIDVVTMIMMTVKVIVGIYPAR
jgi:hypothetical protein